MIPAKGSNIFFFIVSFFLITGNVNGEEEGEEAANKMMVLEFPFDRNKTNTFATTTFAAQQDMADFTVCFAFKVNALISAILDQMQLLQIQDIDGETLAEIVLDVEYDEETFQKTSFGLSSTGGDSNYLHATPFALMTWMRACFSMNNGRVTIAMNGVKLGHDEQDEQDEQDDQDEQDEQDEQDVGLDDNIVRKGNLALHLGQKLTGVVTQVNMFFPALPMEGMINSTDTAGGEECGKEGNLFSWNDFSSETGELILHGKANKKRILQSNGPCTRESRLTVFTSEFQSFFDCMRHCQKLGARSPSVRTLNEFQVLTKEMRTIIPETYDESIIWLSVTQGKMVDNKLMSFDHWPTDVEIREALVKKLSLKADIV